VSAALAVGSVTAANAATPADGTVSKSNPKLAWTGQLAESAIAYNAFLVGAPTPCSAPTCDTFTLTVAEEGVDLVLNIKPAADTETGFRITKPDGSVDFNAAGSTAAKGHTITIEKASKGQYTLDAVNTFVGIPNDYKATAELRFGGAALPPTAEPTVAPAPGEPNGSGNSSSGAPPAQTARLTIKAGKQSAKKLKKAKYFTVAVTSNEPVAKVKVVLARGTTQVGGGTLAQLNGHGKVNVRIKSKLKPGKYSMSVGAYDAKGRTVAASTSVTVRR
jgi:hypothetical protein